MKHTLSEQGLTLVEREVKKKGGALTPQDAAAATGLTLNEAQDALTRLMELYVTGVSYNEEGQVLFRFELPLRQRGEKTLKEKWAAVRESFWRGFKVFYKVWIAIMLIGYFLVSLVLMLALLILASKAGDDDDGPSAAGSMVGGLFRALAEGLRFAFWTRAYGGGYAMDAHGYRYREAKVPAGKGKEKKSYVIAAYDFALGPERAVPDPLENEREAAAFIRAEGGVLTPTDVMALSGGSFDLAEERMADYMARFAGEPRITEEGVVLGEFEDFLTRSSREVDEGAIVHFWDEFEAPWVLTGNSKKQNLLIGFMAFVTLIAGVLVTFGGALEQLQRGYGVPLDTPVISILLGVIPILFGLSYLLLPLLRLPSVRRKEKERLQRNRQKQMMEVIFRNGLFSTTPQEVFEHLPAKSREELGAEGTERELRELLPILQGQIDLDESGAPRYVFPRLAREQAAARSARARGRIAGG